MVGRPDTTIKAVIALMQQGPVSADDLVPLCLSRRASMTMIYRLRKAGHLISFSNGLYVYHGRSTDQIVPPNQIRDTIIKMLRERPRHRDELAAAVGNRSSLMSAINRMRDYGFNVEAFKPPGTPHRGAHTYRLKPVP